MEFGRDPHWQCPQRLHRIENSTPALAPIAKRTFLARHFPLLSFPSSGARGDTSNQMLRVGKTLESSIDAERYDPAKPAKRLRRSLPVRRRPRRVSALVRGKCQAQVQIGYPRAIGRTVLHQGSVRETSHSGTQPDRTDGAMTSSRV